LITALIFTKELVLVVLRIKVFSEEGAGLSPSDIGLIHNIPANPISLSCVGDALKEQSGPPGLRNIVCPEQLFQPQEVGSSVLPLAVLPFRHIDGLAAPGEVESLQALTGERGGRGRGSARLMRMPRSLVPTYLTFVLNGDTIPLELFLI